MFEWTIENLDHLHRRDLTHPAHGKDRRNGIQAQAQIHRKRAKLSHQFADPSFRSQRKCEDHLVNQGLANLRDQIVGGSEYVATSDLRWDPGHPIVEDTKHSHPRVFDSLQPGNNLLTEWTGPHHRHDTRKTSRSRPPLNEQRRAHADRCERSEAECAEKYRPAT